MVRTAELIFLATFALPVFAQNDVLPDPVSAEFCQAAQKLMASTEIMTTADDAPMVPQ